MKETRTIHGSFFLCLPPTPTPPYPLNPRRTAAFLLEKLLIMEMVAGPT